MLPLERGEALLRNPALNKDAAFNLEERNEFGLHGLLPAAIQNINQQVALELEHICSKTNALEQYIGLISLLDRNETLFYRLLIENLDRFTPIIYTPTVGMACQNFSHIFRRSRGFYITPDDYGKIAERWRQFKDRDIRLIIVTDNERILGLGDQGAGGMAIPIGKAILYSAGAGIHPSRCLAVSLDVGTDNTHLLNDAYYLGYRKKRLRGPLYDSLIDEFVQAVRMVFPRAILQWEDFKKATAFRLLARYQSQLPSFNDDIQGTAAVVLAGIFAGLRITGERLRTQRILYLGTGAAGAGIGHLVHRAMREEGLSEEESQLHQLHLDSEGILYSGRPKIEEHKQEFALEVDELTQMGISKPFTKTLLETVRAYRPTILIGTTGHAGAFSPEVITAMADVCKRPMIFPLSNPTQKAECTPTQAILYSQGRALIATGSPFETVHYNERDYVIGQSNNCFIFPGLCLGALASETPRLTESMFLAAARTLAESTTDRRLALHALYPDIRELREISRLVAFKVAQVARNEKIGLEVDDSMLKKLIEESIWFPEYPHLLPIEASKAIQSPLQSSETFIT